MSLADTCHKPGDEKVDLKFTICMQSAGRHIDPTGFEEYRKSEQMWVFNYLQNKIIVEIKEFMRLVEIKLTSRDYSSA
ncbi:hypothetical protein AAVH_24611 [Aphelenchoides avenae]|nr:hypothetical protein AAVH_24611 [Aphelenchus avenae]